MCMYEGKIQVSGSGGMEVKGEMLKFTYRRVVDGATLGEELGVELCPLPLQARAPLTNRLNL